VLDKTNRGHFFEDFRTGQTLRHAVPRTLTEGENALYIGLTGDRSVLHCDAEFARALGYERVRVDSGPKQRHSRVLFADAGYVAIERYNANHIADYFGEKAL